MVEAGIIKQAKVKEKFLNDISGERENYSKPNYQAEISIKGGKTSLRDTRDHS